MSDLSDFLIEDGVLVKYLGTDAVVVVPDGVVEIGEGVFRGYSRLSEITIPNSVTTIGDLAFLGCTNLSSIKIPNSVAHVGYGAFSGCSRLTKISLPDSVSVIYALTFNKCSSLTKVTIPNSVTSINEAAFSGCEYLSEILIPHSVTRIGEMAFENCCRLPKLTLPMSVMNIGSAAFSGCKNLDLTISAPIIHCKADSFSEIKALRLSEKILADGYLAVDGRSGDVNSFFQHAIVYIGNTEYDLKENVEHFIFNYSDYVDSVSDFIGRISTLANARKHNRRFFFRGETMYHELRIPSIMRKKDIEYLKESEKLALYLCNQERKIFFDVISERPQEFSALSRPGDVLSKMQHYGVPTRLLDITGNALMALYFACEKDNDEDGFLSIFDPAADEIKNCYSDTVTMLSILPQLTGIDKGALTILANEHIEKKEFPKELYTKNVALQRFFTEIRKVQPSFEPRIKPKDLLNSVIYIPQKNNTHIERQDGAFILYGLPTKTRNVTWNHEVTFEYEFQNLQPMRLVIDAAKKERIREELDLLGINESAAYTDLSKTADYVKKRYGM